jgi:hypothetical protein
MRGGVAVVGSCIGAPRRLRPHPLVVSLPSRSRCHPHPLVVSLSSRSPRRCRPGLLVVVLVPLPSSFPCRPRRLVVPVPVVVVVVLVVVPRFPSLVDLGSSSPSSSPGRPVVVPSSRRCRSSCQAPSSHRCCPRRCRSSWPPLASLPALPPRPCHAVVVSVGRPLAVVAAPRFHPASSCSRPWSGCFCVGRGGGGCCCCSWPFPRRRRLCPRS